MGRKKKEKKVYTKEEAQRINEEINLRIELKKKEDELRLYSDGQPYDKVRVIGEAKFFLTETAMSIFEAGKRLILLKEKEGHGEFTRIVKDELGLSQPTAWRLMAISRKLANHSRVNDLAIKSLKQGIGKLYAMLDVPDEDLKIFEENGTLLGKPMDDVDRMSVKELRDLVRSHRDRKKTYENKIKKLEDEKAFLQAELFGQKVGLSEDEEVELAKILEIKAIFNNIWYRMDTANLSNASDRMLTEFLNLCEYMHDLSRLLYLRKDRLFNRMESQRVSLVELNQQEALAFKKYPEIFIEKPLQSPVPDRDDGRGATS